MIAKGFFRGGFVFGLISAVAAYGPGSYIFPVKQRCVPGYYGSGCHESCPYPSFGKDCTGTCRCKPDLCHFKTGCPTLGTECPLGYIGRYCDTKCTFPYYGVHCQQTCGCSPSKCSFTSGCPSIKHKSINRISTKKTGTIIITSQKADVSKNLTATEFRTQTSYTDVVNENLTATEFRTETSYRVNATKVLAGKSSPEKRLQINKYTWTNVIFVSLGVLVAVLVIVHVLISVNNCVKEKERTTDV